MDSSTLLVIVVTLGLAGAIAYLFLFQAEKNIEEELEEQEEIEPVGKEKKKRHHKKSGGGKTHKMPQTSNTGKKKAEDAARNNPLKAAELKGHTNQVTSVAFSPDGRLVATAARDQAIIITHLDGLGTRGEAKVWRLNIEYDYASAIRFSDNSKRLVAATASGKRLLFFGIPNAEQAKKGGKPEQLKDFPTTHTEEITHLLLLDVEKWMVLVTSAADDDTELKFWNPKGEMVAHVNTNQIENYMIAASPDGRFVGAACHTPEVKLVEVARKRSGEVSAVTKAMTLATTGKGSKKQGHTNSVAGLAFNKLSTIAATCCKDGSWFLWDINVSYKLDEDPRLLFQSTLSMNCPYAGIVISHSASGGADIGTLDIALATEDGSLIFHRGSTDDTVETIVDSTGASGTGVAGLVCNASGNLIASIGEQQRRVMVWRWPNA
mmetsp:Transcript_5155/g.7844  ORF Transcript_5155/g.7844 Transcript_5155/m.7844 type:complete len:435 (-) Transcript_5155:53-1357(-)